MLKAQIRRARTADYQTPPGGHTGHGPLSSAAGSVRSCPVVLGQASGPLGRSLTTDNKVEPKTPPGMLASASWNGSHSSPTGCANVSDHEFWVREGHYCSSRSSPLTWPLFSTWTSSVSGSLSKRHITPCLPHSGQSRQAVAAYLAVGLAWTPRSSLLQHPQYPGAASQQPGLDLARDPRRRLRCSRSTAAWGKPQRQQTPPSGLRDCEESWDIRSLGQGTLGRLWGVGGRSLPGSWFQHPGWFWVPQGTCRHCS